LRDSEVKEKANVAIAFRLSEFSPQYEILSPSKDANPRNPNTLTSKDYNKVTEKAETKPSFKLPKLARTIHQPQNTEKANTKYTSSKKISGKKLVSLPAICTTKHNRSSFKHPSKTLVNQKQITRHKCMQ